MGVKGVPLSLRDMSRQTVKMPAPRRETRRISCCAMATLSMAKSSCEFSGW